MTESKTPTAVPRAAGADDTSYIQSTSPQNEACTLDVTTRALVVVFDNLITTACPAALWDADARQLAALGDTRRLSTALTMGEACSDRSLVPYYVLAPPLAASTEIVRRAPRLLKHREGDRPGLAEVVARGFRVRFLIRIVDVDTQPHEPITAAQRAHVAGLLAGYPCIFYFTRRGFRVLQVLSRPLTPAEYEVTTTRWIAELQALLGPQWNVDDKCRDWTRHFRLAAHGPVTFQQSSPVDPGDCTPPPKPWKPPVLRRAAPSGNTRYGQAVLNNALETIQTAPEGDRHTRIFKASAAVGGFVAGGELVECLDDLIAVCPEQHERACSDGYARGLTNPKAAPQRNQFDLAALRARALAELQARIAQHTHDDGDVSF